MVFDQRLFLILIPDNSNNYGFKLLPIDEINENKINNFGNNLVEELRVLEKNKNNKEV